MRLNSILDWLAAAIVQNALVTAVMIPIVMLLCRVFRERPAVQNLLWLLVLVKFVTPPIPEWSWRLPIAPASVSMFAGEPAGAAATIGETTDPAIAADRAGEASPAMIVDSQPPLAGRTTAAWPVFRIASYGAIGAWLIGALGWVAIQAVRVRRRYRIVRRGVAAPEPLAAMVNGVARRLGIRALPTIVAPRIASPFLCCLGRVRLIWPEAMSNAEASSTRVIVAHEAAHVARKDHLVAWLEILASAIWWWNPLLWFARRQWRCTAEMSCDALAIATFPEDRCSYAETLLWLSASFKTGAPPFVLAVGGGAPSSLERRMSMIVSERVSGKLSARGILLAGLLALLAVPGWSVGQEGQSKPSLTPSSATEQVAQSPEDRERNKNRLLSMYFAAKSEKREADAEALQVAIDALDAAASRDESSALGAGAIDIPDGGSVLLVGAAAPTVDRSALVLRGYDPLLVRVKVTGSNEGTVWGSDVYTDDSPIPVAAVHAGLVALGDSTEVLLKIEEGRDSYSASERNGIWSAQYGAYGGSYRLAPLAESPDAPYLGSRAALRGNDSAYLTLNMLSGQAPLKPGVNIIVPLVGKPDCPVRIWDAKIYAHESSLDAAAVHAGLIAAGETALVKVVLVAGPEPADELRFRLERVASRPPPGSVYNATYQAVEYREMKDHLVSEIKANVAPKSWEGAGGEGAIAYFDTLSGIVVSQTEDVHREIERYLGELRSRRAEEKKAP